MLKKYLCYCILLLFTLLHILSHLQCVRHYLTWNLELHLPNLFFCHPGCALGKKKCLCILLLSQIHVTSVNSSSSYPFSSQCMPYLKKVLFLIVLSKSREFSARWCYLHCLIEALLISLLIHPSRTNVIERNLIWKNLVCSLAQLQKSQLKRETSNVFSSRINKRQKDARDVMELTEKCLLCFCIPGVRQNKMYCLSELCDTLVE